MQGGGTVLRYTILAVQIYLCHRGAGHVVVNCGKDFDEIGSFIAPCLISRAVMVLSAEGFLSWRFEDANVDTTAQCCSLWE